MERSEIEKKVNDMLVDHLYVAPEQVTSGANIIDDLGADSLDGVELILALEEEFMMEIPDEEAEKITTVKELYDYIEKKKEEQDDQG